MYDQKKNYRFHSKKLLKLSVILTHRNVEIKFKMRDGPKSIVLLGNLLGAGRPAGPVETDFLLTFYKSMLRVQIPDSNMSINLHWVK